MIKTKELIYLLKNICVLNDNFSHFFANLFMKNLILQLILIKKIKYALIIHFNRCNTQN